MAPTSASTPIQFGHQSTASFYQNTQTIEIYPRTSSNNYHAPVKTFNYYQPSTNAEQMGFSHESQMQSAFNSNENFYNYKAYRHDIDEEEEMEGGDDNENEANMGDEGTDEADGHHLMVPSDNTNSHYQQYVHQNQNGIFNNEYDTEHSMRFNPMQAQKIVPNIGGNGSGFYQNNLLIPNYNYCNNHDAYAANGSSATTSTENGSHLPQGQMQLDEVNAFSLYNIQSSANQTPIVTQHQNNNLLDPNGQFNANNAPNFDYSSLSLNDTKTDILSNKKLPDWSLNSYKSKSKHTIKFLLTLNLKLDYQI
jgi:hypothetical protein